MYPFFQIRFLCGTKRGTLRRQRAAHVLDLAFPRSKYLLWREALAVQLRYACSLLQLCASAPMRLCVSDRIQLTLVLFVFFIGVPVLSFLHTRVPIMFKKVRPGRRHARVVRGGLTSFIAFTQLKNVFFRNVRLVCLLSACCQLILTLDELAPTSCQVHGCTRLSVNGRVYNYY